MSKTGNQETKCKELSKLVINVGGFKSEKEKEDARGSQVNVSGGLLNANSSCHVPVV